MKKTPQKSYLLLTVILWGAPYSSYSDSNTSMKPGQNGFTYDCYQAYANDNISVSIKNDNLRLRLIHGYVSGIEPRVKNTINFRNFNLTIPNKDCVWSTSDRYLFSCKVQSTLNINYKKQVEIINNSKKHNKYIDKELVVFKANIYATRRSTIYPDDRNRDEILLNMTYLSKNRKHEFIKIVTQFDTCKINK